MKRVLLDTNFLMIPYQFRVDIFSQIDRILDFKYELVVLDKTVDELKNIILTQRGKHKEAAKIALKLIAIKKIKKITCEGSKGVDDTILELAVEKGYFVATQDKELKRKLKEKNGTLLVLRQRKTIVLLNEKIA